MRIELKKSIIDDLRNISHTRNEQATNPAQIYVSALSRKPPSSFISSDWSVDRFVSVGGLEPPTCVLPLSVAELHGYGRIVP